MEIKFGVFDHLDRNNLPLPEYYEARLALIEAYERAGFYSYHLAEHHQTPLGMAPSPSVFLAAVAQRTRVMRFGPMVYALPLYHPLRMIEEICMLDQMSNGRLDIGFGRGASPIELAYYGQDPAKAQRNYAESLELVLKGLTEKTLDFEGEFHRFRDVPMELEPLQKPHPPIWYGAHTPESAERAARKRLHIISLDPPDEARLIIERYRSVRAEMPSAMPAGADAAPMMGIGRFVVLARSDDAALALARRAYARWNDSFTFLFRKHGTVLQRFARPPDFDGVIAVGQGFAGSPATVHDAIRKQIDETGANYFVGQFAFGDLPQAETRASLDLFVNEVMPELKRAAAR